MIEGSFILPISPGLLALHSKSVGTERKDIFIYFYFCRAFYFTSPPLRLAFSAPVDKLARSQSFRWSLLRWEEIKIKFGNFYLAN